jgi:hypothetical protein
VVSVYNGQSYFGLGDYIRGIIHLYQNTNNVYINYEDNEIAKYLYNNNGNNHSYVQNEIKITNEINYFQNIPNEINYLYHNAGIEYPIDKNILNQVKNMFTMKPEFKMYFNKILYNHGLINGKFAVLHLRYDDTVFTKDVVKNKIKLNKFIEKVILKKWKQNVLILSNSTLTKEHLCNKYNFKQYDFTPVHTGAIGVFAPDKIRGTLVEFFTMTKSKEIFQYCEIENQVSGFSKRINEIYNIPITCIQ